ncbi:MAG TPA: hypothetical protein VJK03_03560 [Candidatus Nanoarchaeia archaeon]|nr:hypothetical protein [Candidatus Nanoarchaeia archaeon]
MEAIWLGVGLGALGGVVRATVGLFKAMAVNMKIVWRYWIFTVFLSALIGAMTGLIFNFDPRLSVLAGYAGTDLLEGIYKSFQIQKVYVPPSRR